MTVKKFTSFSCKLKTLKKSVSKKSASIKDDNDDVFTIGINRAIDLIIEKENNPSKRRKFTRKKIKK